MYNPDNDIEIRYSTKHLPIEYKLLEWRLIINRELYEDKVIDLEVFSEMEKSILGRMTKIRTTMPTNAGMIPAAMTDESGAS